MRTTVNRDWRTRDGSPGQAERNAGLIVGKFHVAWASRSKKSRIVSRTYCESRYNANPLD